MRPVDLARRPPPTPATPGRRLLTVLGAAVLVLGLFARGLAGIYTDYLWFDSLDLAGAWTTLLSVRVGVAVCFALALFLLVWANLKLADRLAPEFPPPGLEEEAIAPVREVIDLRRGALRIAVAVVLALMFGASMGSQWNEWILLRNHVPFGVDDPQFGHDIGFYVFQLPFLRAVADWIFAALVLTTIVTAALHYLNGGFRLRPPIPPMQAATRRHLSILFASIAAAKGFNYFLDRYQLLHSPRGVVEGAGYTDVTAQLPALNLLIAISLLATALFLVNLVRQRWTLDIIAVGSWAAVAVLVGIVYPAMIQRFRVEPAESQREAPYIARNIEATRRAMRLDDVRIRPFAYDEELSAEALVQNEETIRNVRLWDPRVLRQTYQRLQEVRSFYRFTDVDIDRYPVGGRTTQIVLSARELNPDSLPSDTWENRHLAFTHGYGAVLSPANAVTSDGQPDFLVKNIPPQGAPEIEQPRLYHGERLGGYAVVNAGRDEIDYLKDDGTPVTTRYDGDSGVDIGTPFRRAAFALRFADINPLISGFMTSDSRILYLRDVRERVQAIAPFLHFDHDPYPVVVDGRVTWVIDAYTTSAAYPYAETVDTDRLEPDSGLAHRFNYVRNSVKATVDAYDGTVRFYIVDDEDPIAAAYARAFPKVFSPDAEVPPELAAHFRYPEDLFRVQTNMWGRYHIDDPSEFYSQSDRWNVAQDPDSTLRQTTSPTTTTQGAATTAPTREGRMDPYYLLMRLPGASDTEFLILQPFVPFSQDDSRRELSAFMVAKSDPGEYGKLEVFVMPRDRQVDGPAIVNARINQEPEVSQLITLLSRAGSGVLLGNLLVIPVEQSLIYVRPLYVQATGANAVPELKKVIVAFGNRIAIHDSLQQALVAVFGAAPDTLEEGLSEPITPDGTPPVGGGDGLSSDAQALLDRAATAFAAADAALRDGDPVEYARQIQEGRRLFQEAREAGAATTTTTAP